MKDEKMKIAKKIYIGLNFTLILFSVMYNYCQYKCVIFSTSLISTKMTKWTKKCFNSCVVHANERGLELFQNQVSSLARCSRNSFYIHRVEVCHNPIFNTRPVITLNIRRQDFMSANPSREKCVI